MAKGRGVVSPLKSFYDFVLSKFVFKGGGKGDGGAPAPAKVLFFYKSLFFFYQSFSLLLQKFFFS
jgi:hypothetical protein